MAEPKEDKTNIITIAIIAHGQIIDAELSPQRTSSFEDVRLFSYSGVSNPTSLSHIDEHRLLNTMNFIFRKNLDKPTMNVITDVRNKILNAGIANNSTPTENQICTIFENISFDKIIGASTNIFCKLLNCIMPSILGIFLISVHEKHTDNNYECIYPPLPYSPPVSLNLLNIDDLSKFANIYNKTIDANSLGSLPLPKNSDNDFLQKMQEWNIELKNNQIENIRLSKLAELIKYIAGSNCKINIMDFSCSAVMCSELSNYNKNKKYIVESDIENKPHDSNWGGKNKHSNTRKKRKNKKRHGKSTKMKIKRSHRLRRRIVH